MGMCSPQSDGTSHYAIPRQPHHLRVRGYEEDLKEMRERQFRKSGGVQQRGEGCPVPLGAPTL
eukprot:3936221-Rhodomonas_salina.2